MEIEPLLRETLAQRIGQTRFDRWFSSDIRFSRHEDRVAVTAPNKFSHDWLIKHYQHQIVGVCRDLFGRGTSVEFRVGGPSRPANEKPSPADRLNLSPESIEFKEGAGETAPVPAKTPAPRKRAERTGGRLFASYETFVVGVSNNAAKGIADIAIARPGMLNPVLIYGPTSVGKTHLLEGVYGEFRRNHGRKSPKFLTADEFTGQFVQGFQEKPGGDRSLRVRLLDSNLLIIEDIQNLERREATQRELCNLIDLFLSKGIQMIFSADRPLAEMTFLKPELRTRLESGVVCGIESPDRETLLRIFRQMTEKRMLNIPDEICRFVVSRFTAHARQLSGALNLLHAAHLTGKDITSLDSVSKILETLSPCRQAPITLSEIENAVSAVFGVQSKDLRGRSRSRQCSYPRMLAMWLARKYTRSALSEIGRHFGGRSHSTVAAAQKKVDLWLEDRRNSEFSESLRRVEQVLASRNR